MAPLDPPFPIDATASIATKIFTITFNRPLAPGLLNVANWRGDANLDVVAKIWIPFGPPTAAGSQVTFTGLAIPGVPPSAPDVTYAPPPFDVTGTTGVPATAFADFPLTVIP